MKGCDEAAFPCPLHPPRMDRGAPWNSTELLRRTPERPETTRADPRITGERPGTPRNAQSRAGEAGGGRGRMHKGTKGTPRCSKKHVFKAANTRRKANFGIFREE